MGKKIKRISPIKAGFALGYGKLSDTDIKPGFLQDKINTDGSLTKTTVSGKVKLELPATGVVAGTYNTANITVNENGLITAIADGAMAGPAGGDLGGSYPNPKVVALTDGVELTRYPIGAIADGDYLKNTGGSVVGSATIPPPDTSGAGGDLGGTYPNPSVGALTDQGGPTVYPIGAIANGDYLKNTGGSVVGSATTPLASILPTNDVQVRTGCVRYEAPIAADTTSIKASALPANGLITLAGQPDYPRKLQVKVVSAASTNDILTGTLYLEGIGPSGESVADVFDLNVGAGVTTTYTSSNAYATVTKGSVSNLTFGAGGGAGSTLEVGVASALGVPSERPSVVKDSQSISQKFIIPAYFRPGSATPDAYWDQMVTSPVGSVIIFNPFNGPGVPADEAVYRTKVKACHDAGMKCVGYVSTLYGARDINLVTADIDTYYSRYAIGGVPYIDGIFVDEVASIKSKEVDPVIWATDYNYYKAIFDHVHTTLGKTNDIVVQNPGASVDHSLQDIADIVIGFENTRTVYNSWRHPAWQFQYPASKNAILIKQVSYANLPANLKRVKSENWGYIYITLDGYDEGGGVYNPWDTLPTDSPNPYWTAMKNSAADTVVEIKGTVTPTFRFYEDRGNINLEWQYCFHNKSNYANIYRNIHFDIDQNPATGFSVDYAAFPPATSTGSDYLIEATYSGGLPTATTARLYRRDGAAWTFIKLITATAADQGFSHGLKCVVSRADLGNVVGPINVSCEIKDPVTAYSGIKCSSIATVAAADLPPSPLPEKFAVHKANVNDVNEVVGTVDTFAGTIVPTSVPNGSRSYQFWYTYTVTPVQNTHLHT